MNFHAWSFCLRGKNVSGVESSVVDPNFGSRGSALIGSPGSGSVLGGWIRIQEQGNWQELANKHDFQPLKKACTFVQNRTVLHSPECFMTY
jgi:hypothetical protein